MIIYEHSGAYHRALACRHDLELHRAIQALIDTGQYGHDEWEQIRHYEIRNTFRRTRVVTRQPKPEYL